MNEVDIEVVDGGDELIEPVELGFAGSPVVLLCPVAADVLQVGERRALRPIVDQLAFGPPRVAQPESEIVEDLVTDVDREGSDVSAHRVNVRRANAAS